MKNQLQRLGYNMSLNHQEDNYKKYKNTSNNSNGTVPYSNSNMNNNSKYRKKDRERLRIERESLKIWSRPIDTFKYFLLECITLSKIYGKKLLEHKKCIAVLFFLTTLITVFYHIPGKHQSYFDSFREHAFFVTYWVGLGVLSSVGLGTGLHTFLLYLGPHIASVTLAAYECNSLDFPKPPYPDEIICPEAIDANFIPSLWNIMSKVRLEAFLWGAGTALGELPPYFMAKAARLSGYDPEDDEDLKKFDELQKKRATGENLTILDRGKLFMEQIVERIGFWGILACASIPNPLFDLAGITCGHFLVPFGTFFGATLIGKAVIKMHIQKIFVIIAFNEPLIERAVNVMGKVPMIGKKLQEPFKAFLTDQKTKYHRRSNTKLPESRSKLAKMFEIFVVAMIVYFVASIINSFAQNYHKRLHKKVGNSHRKTARD
ncbi:vacuole membrane protein 1 isoform X2 [Culicoides brevitarsis]|uniref:vacuole membrane protein 1 isoform X2 n=1 Tax=Culicoides brevitarsis TaxID=469753 RepID=UPI00307B3518